METERVLRELLKDETANLYHLSADTISKVEFGVRATAYRSLKVLGKPVPKIELERKPTRQEQRSQRQSYWRKSFDKALSDGWNVTSVKDGTARRVAGLFYSARPEQRDRIQALAGALHERSAAV